MQAVADNFPIILTAMLISLALCWWGMSHYFLAAKNLDQLDENNAEASTKKNTQFASQEAVNRQTLSRTRAMTQTMRGGRISAELKSVAALQTQIRQRQFQRQLTTASETASNIGIDDLRMGTDIDLSDLIDATQSARRDVAPNHAKVETDKPSNRTEDSVSAKTDASISHPQPGGAGSSPLLSESADNGALQSESADNDVLQSDIAASATATKAHWAVASTTANGRSVSATDANRDKTTADDKTVSASGKAAEKVHHAATGSGVTIARTPAKHSADTAALKTPLATPQSNAPRVAAYQTPGTDTGDHKAAAKLLSPLIEVKADRGTAGQPSEVHTDESHDENAASTQRPSADTAKTTDASDTGVNAIGDTNSQDSAISKRVETSDTQRPSSAADKPNSDQAGLSSTVVNNESGANATTSADVKDDAMAEGNAGNPAAASEKNTSMLSRLMRRSIQPDSQTSSAQVTASNTKDSQATATQPSNTTAAGSQTSESDTSGAVQSSTQAPGREATTQQTAQSAVSRLLQGRFGQSANTVSTQLTGRTDHSAKSDSNQVKSGESVSTKPSATTPVGTQHTPPQENTTAVKGKLLAGTEHRNNLEKATGHAFQPISGTPAAKRTDRIESDRAVPDPVAPMSTALNPAALNPEAPKPQASSPTEDAINVAKAAAFTQRSDNEKVPATQDIPRESTAEQRSPIDNRTDKLKSTATPPNQPGVVNPAALSDRHSTVADNKGSDKTATAGNTVAEAEKYQTAAKHKHMPPAHEAQLKLNPAEVRALSSSEAAKAADPTKADDRNEYPDSNTTAHSASASADELVARTNEATDARANGYDARHRSVGTSQAEHTNHTIDRSAVEGSNSTESGNTDEVAQFTAKAELESALALEAKDQQIKDLNARVAELEAKQTGAPAKAPLHAEPAELKQKLADTAVELKLSNQKVGKLQSTLQALQSRTAHGQTAPSTPARVVAHNRATLSSKVRVLNINSVP